MGMVVKEEPSCRPIWAGHGSQMDPFLFWNCLFGKESKGETSVMKNISMFNGYPPSNLAIASMLANPERQVRTQTSASILIRKQS